MMQEGNAIKLYNVGVSYKKADVSVRGAYSITKENQKLLLEEAKRNGIDGIFVLSTCNRTEISGLANHPFQLISLLIKYSSGTVEEFSKISNVYIGNDAIRHLFKIGTGLDSQILGDYEIVGQIKEAVKLAKEIGTLNAYLERLMNLVLQASKDVKNHTKLSSGTTSVSYAAIQYLIENVKNYNTKQILIYGLGDIGKNTFKNILEYTNNKNITLVNRTQEKVTELKKDYPDVNSSTIENLPKEIAKTDILIVSTGATSPTIFKEQIPIGKKMLILDMSLPNNVASEISTIEGITVVNVDELSKITLKTIEIRNNEVPAAEEIIKKYKEEFKEWISIRKFVPAVNALKESLTAIKDDEIDFQAKKIKDFNVEHAEVVTNRLIQKITTQFVKHLKDEETSVDQSINIISKMFNIKEMSLNENN